MKKTIVLVRHATHAEVGRVLSGRSDIALSDAGLREAAALAAALRDQELASIHVSPRLRAQQTAAPIMHHAPIRVASALDEIDFGDFTGRSFAELDGDSAWHRWNSHRAEARCPNGETMPEAIARAAAYLAAIAPEDCPALCVTHCDIIRGLVAETLGLGLDRLFGFDCDPASRTTLEWSDGDRRLVALNERVRP